MLRENIVPGIKEAINDKFAKIWYLQDAAAPHYGINVPAYVKTSLIRRWIGRRTVIEWRASSPDLALLDYFLWGYLKSKVCKTKPANLKKQQIRILKETGLVDGQMIRRVVVKLY